MEWIEVNLQVTHEAVEAVADIFNTLRAGGVVIDDPLLLNHLRDSGTWELCDIPKQENTEIVKVTAYFPNDKDVDKKLAAVEDGLQLIEKRIGSFRFGTTKFRKLSEHDWANEWKQYFHTTHVGKSLIIKPTWEKYEPKENEKVIAIDPGMAFGTGTHHTTNMCMQVLEKIVKQDMTVFDVGTGSGILAMTAALLGAKEIKAVDIDNTAVKVAKENIALNNLSERIDVKQGDLLQGTEGKADIIIANIIADIIVMLLPDIPQKLKEHGLFLASGIIDTRVEDVKMAAAKAKLKIVSISEKGGWAAILMTKEK